jgi:hypothetical protein
MLPPIEHRHPEWIAALARRIDDGEFDKIVLVRPIEDSEWYDTVDLGSTVSAAIRRSYRLAAQVAPGYWIYVPEEG